MPNDHAWSSAGSLGRDQLVVAVAVKISQGHAHAAGRAGKRLRHGGETFIRAVIVVIGEDAHRGDRSHVGTQRHEPGRHTAVFEKLKYGLTTIAFHVRCLGLGKRG
jgi:hypothetical protein